MIWMRIRLELARAPSFPEGSHRHGYEFILPLKADGSFDKKAYDKIPELCTVHRFWEGEGDDVGEIVHTTRRHWAFSYAAGDADDEPVVHFEKHNFRPDEYMTVREPGGPEHTFRIVKVEPAPGLVSARVR